MTYRRPPDIAVNPAETAVPGRSKNWQRRKGARPGEILDAALQVFAEKGFAAARMEDIAVAAGVTKGTIYLYFPSKEEVFKSLARETVGVALAGAGQALEGFEGAPAEKISAMLRLIQAFLLNPQRAALPKIILSESGNFPELAQFWRDEVVDKAVGLLMGAYAQGVREGVFRDLPGEHVARLCVAPLILGVIWRATFLRPEDPPFDFDAFLSTHLAVLLGGLSVKGTEVQS